MNIADFYLLENAGYVMIKIETFESGSSGNLHLIQDGNKKLMLDCGVPIKKIMNYMDLDVSGCLLSHYHADHSKAAKQVMKFGINLYCTKETSEYLGLSGRRLKIIEADKWFDVDGFSCLSFRTNHDTPGSVGYLIDSGQNRVLFATDTSNLPYRFPGLNYIILECNYTESIINNEDEIFKDRIEKTHMGLNDVKDFLKNNDISSVKEIRLVHLSDRNADPEFIKIEIQKLTGIPIIIS